MNKKPNYKLFVRQKLEDNSYGPTQELYIYLYESPGLSVYYNGNDYKINAYEYIGDRHTRTEGFSIPQTKEEILNASIPPTNEFPKIATNPGFNDSLRLHMEGMAGTWAKLTVDNRISAPDFLRKAQNAMQARAKQRDAANGERSMAKTVAAFNAIYGKELTEEEGWAFMILLKMVRGSQGKFNDDDYVDGAAYFALLGECCGKKTEV